MAVRDISEKERKFLQGASSSYKFEKRDEPPKKSILLNVPLGVVEKIEESIQKSVFRKKRTAWILEAISEKLEKEDKKPKT